MKVMVVVRVLLLAATAFFAVEAAMAASTAGCFRDIRKDTRDPMNPNDDVIYDFGCTTADVCPPEKGLCQPLGGSYGGMGTFACACDGIIAEAGYLCLLTYLDTTGTSTLGEGGGVGGTYGCATLECNPKLCEVGDGWVDVGDPDVLQKADDCKCE